MAVRGTAFSNHEASERPRASVPTRFKSWLLGLRGRPPFTWSGKRKRRWVIGFVLALLAYPVLGTVALWTGFVEWVLRSEDLRVEIRNPAYTIWPGRVRMKHVRILANGTTQFILDGNDLRINVRVLPLVKGRVHVTELAAHDVIYQMRVQVKDTKGIEKRIAAYPPLNDLPGAKVIREAPAKQSEESDSDWTVEVDGIDVAVKELWFFEYRYLGKGRLRGGFLVGPNLMEVSTAVQDLGPGELRFGPTQTVAKNLRGQITANIPRVNPNEHADASFMELVTARVNMKSEIESLSNLGAYAQDLEVSDGSGPLAVDLYLDRGKLGPKSRLDYATDSVRLKGSGFGIASDLLVKFDAAGSQEKLPLVQTESKSSYVSLSRGMRSFTIQIHGHREEAQLDTIQLSRATDLKAASIRMPDIRSVDLRDLPAVLPEGAPIVVHGGEARASLRLDMDEKFWARGPLHTTVKDVDLEAARLRFGANLELRSELRFNPKERIFRAEDVAFRVRDMRLRAGERSIDGWWMNLDGERLTFRDGKPSRFDAKLSVRTRDLEPVLQSLAEKDVVTELLPAFTSLHDFRAGANIHSAGSVTDVSVASESEIWDASGRVHKTEKRTLLALVVGGQAVSLGVADLGDGLELMPFAKTGWLNERLQRFPKPLVEMQPAKP